MNKKYTKFISYLLLISLIPLLTACSIKIPSSVDDIKNLFSKTEPEAAKDEKPLPEDQSPFEAEIKPIETGLGKLEEILANKKSMECTYTFEDLTGTIYTDGKDLLFNSKIKTGVELMEVSTLMKDDYMYSWAVGQSTGTKFAINDVENPKESEENATPAPELPDQIKYMSYTCEEKEIEASTFELPQGVEFVDPTQALNDAPDTNIDYCKACDQSTSLDEREACKTALNCE